MPSSSVIPWQQPEIIQLSQRAVKSFEYWLERPLIEVEDSPEAIAIALFEAPFVLMAHDTYGDTTVNYGNRMALERFGADWETFTEKITPSLYSAEPLEREERKQLLLATRRKGFIPEFKTVRLTQSGERFRVEDGIFWNLLDEQSQHCGQANLFTKWTILPRKLFNYGSPRLGR